MRARTVIATAIAAGSLAAIGAVGAGCGDDESTTSTVTSSTSTTAAEAVSTEEFVTAADARCAEANAAVANLVADGSGSSTVIQQQIDITEQTVKGLKSLGSPDDPDGSLSDYYDAVKQEVAVLGQQQDALASGDSATADSLSVQLDQAQSEAQAAAESFGFEECGQQGTTISSDATTTGTPPDVAATTTTPVTPAPTTTTPAPVPEPVTPPPSGGTSGGTGSGGTSGGGSSGGSSGGISPGG